MQKPDDARAAGLTEEVLTGADADAAVEATPRLPVPEDEIELEAYPTLDPAALTGLVGDVVDAFDPYTEADRASVATAYLAGYGNAVGRGPYCEADGAEHHCNLFVGQVGATSSGRKGTGTARGLMPVKLAAPDWGETQIISGLTSGEGLIHAVRDAAQGHAATKKNAPPPDPGVTDKRLCVYEPELSRVLRVGTREGNSLMPLLRLAWDAGRLATMAKTCGETATGAHVTLIAHIVADELAKYLHDSEVAGGLGNRFLWVAVRRSKMLPNPGRIPGERLDRLVERTRTALLWGGARGLVERNPEAEELWRCEYPALTAAHPDKLGEMTSRGAPQVVRLSLIYAMLDMSPVIQVAHLRAALALWRYCEASVRYIFGRRLGNKDAERLLQALRDAGADGLSRTQVTREVFRGHVAAERIRDLLMTLEVGGLAHRAIAPSRSDQGGRRAERWFYGANYANYAHNEAGGGRGGAKELRTMAKEPPCPTLTGEHCSQCSHSFASASDAENLARSQSAQFSQSSQAYAGMEEATLTPEPLPDGRMPDDHVVTFEV